MGFDTQCLGNSISVVEDSHTGFGAAFKLVINVLQRVRPRIELSDRHAASIACNKNALWLVYVWRRVLSEPIDVMA